MSIVINPAGGAEAWVWATALELVDVFDTVPWVLVGALMVVLLEREAGRPSGRATRDVDVVVDVRLLVGGTRTAAARLAEAGFELHSAEHPCRFVRGASSVDLLAPDHVGPHADLTTVPPAMTTEVPGGSRALALRRLLEVDVAGADSGPRSVPSTAGAINLKVRAGQARAAQRDLEDLVRLLALVTDLDVVASELKPAERRALGSIAALADSRHPAWRAVADSGDARIALARLRA